MSQILYPIVKAFFDWQIRMKKISNQIPVVYLQKQERKRLEKEQALKDKIMSWSDYYYYWFYKRK